MGCEEKFVEETLERIKKLKAKHRGMSEALFWLYWEGFKQGVYATK